MNLTLKSVIGTIGTLLLLVIAYVILMSLTADALIASGILAAAFGVFFLYKMIRKYLYAHR